MVHCSVSKEDLQEKASHFIYQFQIKDENFKDFCKIVFALSILKVSLHLDFSYTSSYIRTVLKLIQTFVVAHES